MTVPPPPDDDFDYASEVYPKTPLVRIEFPSDALSIRRLRHLAPHDFDIPMFEPDSLEPGNLYFGENGSRPEWIDGLNKMLGFERVVAQEIFHRTRGDRRPFGQDEEDRSLVRKLYLDPARPTLEALYQWFRLADSPESARFLITLIEKQAVQLAHESLSPGRTPS